jgi:hypothetical protein
MVGNHFFYLLCYNLRMPSETAPLFVQETCKCILCYFRHKFNFYLACIFMLRDHLGMEESMTLN